jgi:hypothetical protein
MLAFPEALYQGMASASLKNLRPRSTPTPTLTHHQTRHGDRRDERQGREGGDGARHGTDDHDEQHQPDRIQHDPDEEFPCGSRVLLQSKSVHDGARKPIGHPE